MEKKRREYPKITFSKSKNLFRATYATDNTRRDVYGKSREEVMDKIDALDEEAAHGASSMTTLAEYAARWFAIKTAGMKPKSKHAYYNSVTNHILPQLGQLPLSDIKPIYVDEFLASMQNYSSSICSKALSALSQIMESALENDLIQKNPCRGRKSGGKPVVVKSPLTREQQKTLCDSTRGTRAHLFVLLCLYAGLRREEALGSLWDNVHFEVTPYTDDRHTVTFDKGRPIHSDALKSKAAYRTIPIPPQLSTALHSESREDSLVCPASGGGVMSLSAFNRMWDIVTGYKYTAVKRGEDGAKEKGPDGKSIPVKAFHPGVIDFEVSPHQLRHTYITELCASGLDVKKIQYLAGHSRVQITLDIYTHVTQNRPEQLAPDIIKAFVRE